MERSSKRGKIPQQDWRSIIQRYEAGETLASIARTYDCSPPAISYILSRSRARDTTPEEVGRSGLEPLEPQLVNGDANDPPATDLPDETPEIGEGAAHIPAAQPSYPMAAQDPEPRLDKPALDKKVELVVSEPASHRDAEVPVHGAPVRNGISPEALDAPARPPRPTEARRTLHLSMSHNNAQLAEPPNHDGRSAEVAEVTASRPVTWAWTPGRRTWCRCLWHRSRPCRCRRRGPALRPRFRWIRRRGGPASART